MIDGYRRVVDRVLALAVAADPTTQLPTCPAWTVHDLVAHLTGLAEDWVAGNLDGYGSDEWTAAQVTRGSGATLDELAARWRRAADGLGDVPDHPLLGAPASMAFVDAVTHEADLRDALGIGGVPLDEVRPAMKGLVARWRQTLGAAGAPPLLVRVEGDRDWAIGAPPADGPPPVTVDVGLYDLFRALTGRRSAAQVAGWRWSADPGPFVAAGLPYPFSWAAGTG